MLFVALLPSPLLQYTHAPTGTLLIPQEPFELLVRRSIGRLTEPSLQCKVCVCVCGTFLLGVTASTVSHVGGRCPPALCVGWHLPQPGKPLRKETLNPNPNLF